jgi:hypothetical protein
MVTMSNGNKAMSRPTFSGSYIIPTNITVIAEDDDGFETTRQIGGVGIMPSFQPMLGGDAFFQMGLSPLVSIPHKVKVP